MEGDMGGGQKAKTNCLSLEYLHDIVIRVLAVGSYPEGDQDVVVVQPQLPNHLQGTGVYLYIL